MHYSEVSSVSNSYHSFQYFAPAGHQYGYQVPPHQVKRSVAATSQPKSLPCKKMITTGICTYRNRCHYIHDVRIMNPTVKGCCRKKNKTEESDQRDNMFFWPPMTTAPGHEARSYAVSVSSDPLSGSIAVASLWYHFVEMCKVESVKHKCPQECVNNYVADPMNPVTKRPRLPVFVKLSRGDQLEDNETQLHHDIMNMENSNAFSATRRNVYEGQYPRSRKPFDDKEERYYSPFSPPAGKRQFPPPLLEKSEVNILESSVLLSKRHRNYILGSPTSVTAAIY